MSKKLVACFSAGGVTLASARRLAKVLGADLCEIRPKTPYTRSDLDWTDKKSRSSLETKDPDSRPEIAGDPLPTGDYDTVFIGFPIWWYAAPKIIHTFLERNDFSGKTLIPFATSGGSGMGKTTEILRSVCPDANWKEGKIVNGMSEKDLAAWANTF